MHSLHIVGDKGGGRPYNWPMATPHLHGLYGLLPPVLGIAEADAVQLSPLLPGSHALEEILPGSLASISVIAPPGTIERHYLLALALRTLAPDGNFTILAHKDKGGSRLGRELQGFGCTLREDARKHYRICQGTRPALLLGIEGAMETGQMQFIASLGLWSQPGVFSWNHLDRGSAILLQHLPRLQGRGVDLGCGIGVLSRAALTVPAITQLTLVDSDRRAIDAARRNIDDPRAEFRWADVRTPMPDLTQRDFVLMNPPFHDGGMEDKTLGQFFVKCAAAMLRPGGECWLIANRHLPYEALLHQLFREATPIHEAEGFKLYRAVK